MSLLNFLSSHFLESKNLKLIGSDYTIAGSYFFSDGEFVYLRDEDGKLQGIRLSLIDKVMSLEPVPGELPEGFARMVTPQKSSEGNDSSVSAGSINVSALSNTNREKPQETGTGETHVASDVTETFEAKQQSTGATFKKFKPGDRIPLDELTQRDPRIANNWKRKAKKEAFQSALSEKVQTVLKEIETAGRAEDGYSLVAFGKIIELQPGFLFGFIDDTKDGHRYYFNRSDIADPKLRETSGSDIPVVYHRGQNHKGYAARAIMMPSSVTDSLSLAADLIKEGELITAKQVVSNVLEIYPENDSALKFKETYTAPSQEVNDSDEEGYFRGDEESREMFRFFNEGKKLMSAKDYRGAIQSFQTALDNGFKPEAGIKNIIQAYIALHSSAATPEEKEKIAREAGEFLKEYRNRLSDDLKTLFLLENFYFSTGDYTRHIDVVEEVIAVCGRNDDIPQFTFYLNKAAKSYMKLGEYDKAMDAVMDGLEADPEHPQLQRTQFELMEAMGSQETQKSKENF